MSDVMKAGVSFLKLALVVALEVGLLLSVPVACAEKILPSFCEKVELDGDLISHDIISRKKLPQIKDFVARNSDLYMRFMKRYRGSLPTIIVIPPHVQDDMTFFEMTQSDVPDFNAIRSTARAMLVFGDLQFHIGQPERAAATYLNVVKLGMDVGHGFGTLKFLITHMISIAVQKRALERLADLLATGEMTAAQERALLKKVDALFEDRVPVAEAFLAERKFLESFDFKKHFSLKAFSMVDDEEAQQKEMKQSILDKTLLFFFGSRATRHLKEIVKTYYDEVEKGLGKSYLKSRSHFNKSTIYIQQLNKDVEQGSKVFSPARYMALVLAVIAIPNATRAYAQEVAVFSLRDGMKIIHLLNEYRRQRGSYPGILSPLGKMTLPGGSDRAAALLIDPFSGKNYMYRKAGNAFILYSTGFDEQDDSGNISTDLVIHDGTNGD